MSSPGSPLRRFTSFASGGIVGFIVDAAILSTLVHAFGWHHYMIPALVRLPVLPLAAGAVLALLFNYSAASRWVFAAPAGRRE